MLNDAGSDMLAASVHDYAGIATGWEFDIGEDCWLTAGQTAIRYMSRPSDDGASCDHYSTVGSCSTMQHGAGIGNHWFYLLSVGGKHHNPAHRSGVTVRRIGIAAAYKIWYRAITVYMTSTTNFAGARAATAAACGDLYSASVCNAVSDAWTEVGV